MATVKLNRVNVDFASVRILKNIDLEIAEGEFLVLVGPSGCGKSTTLRVVAGLTKASSGSVEIGGKKVDDVPPGKRDIAMVFQNYSLFPHMTVYENLAWGERCRKKSAYEIKQGVGRVAETLGLTGLLDRLPRQLSGGERQRVALGRAIIRKPVVFLYDEPLSNLDANLRVQMRVEIKELHAQRLTTSIYVTHDQVEAMTLGDRVALMQDGKIIQIGTPLEIYRRPNQIFVASFIGSPPMNFLHASLIEESGSIYAVARDVRLRVPTGYESGIQRHSGKDVVLGIRPEHITVDKAGSSQELTFPAKIEVIEQLGQEIILNSLAGGTMIKVSRVSPDFAVTRGESIELSVKGEFMHFFDPGTGRALVC